MSFATLIERFEHAARTHDAAALAALFAPDGRYHDGFFGEHAGRDAIAAMLTKPKAAHGTMTRPARCKSRKSAAAATP